MSIIHQTTNHKSILHKIWPSEYNLYTFSTCAFCIPPIWIYIWKHRRHNSHQTIEFHNFEYNEQWNEGTHAIEIHNTSRSLILTLYLSLPWSMFASHSFVRFSHHGHLARVFFDSTDTQLLVNEIDRSYLSCKFIASYPIQFYPWNVSISIANFLHTSPTLWKFNAKRFMYNPR